MPSTETEKVLNHHLETLLTGDVDGVMEDYDDASVLMTNIAGVTAGRAAIRELMSSVTLTGFEMTTLHIEGDYALAIWKADGITLGTDTFHVRDGKIVMQTATIQAA